MKERILSALSQSEIEKEKKYLEGQKHGRQVICPIGQANQLIVFQIVGFHTLQMLTDKLLINYYFHMLLLQVKMCNLFKGG